MREVIIGIIVIFICWISKNIFDKIMYKKPKAYEQEKSKIIEDIIIHCKNNSRGGRNISITSQYTEDIVKELEKDGLLAPYSWNGKSDGSLCRKPTDYFREKFSKEIYKR